MKLELIEIKGFRKLNNIKINLGDTSFLIGENNSGKSSILKAIELILTNSNAEPEDYSKRINNENGSIENVDSEIVLTATFSHVPEEADSWIGFKGRVFKENDIRKIKYKKTFSNGQIKFEIWEQNKEIKDSVKVGSKVTIASLISSNILKEKVYKIFEGISENQNLTTKTYLPKLEEIYEAWDYDDEFSWINNPGGIPQNVISKLPKFILIPAEHKANEIDSNKKTALGEIMSTIFGEIVEKSESFEKVKKYFGQLEKEVDTGNIETEFGKLMVNVNKTIKNIFPDSEILAKVNLSNPGDFLTPKYDIKLGSNIMTNVSYQGTGMIRSTAFSLLKFREDWRKKRDKDLRSLIIGFEEPELFLHPNAANQMRETIYDLAGSNNQIICTSHSPYMIDLSRENKNQIINNISINEDTFVQSIPFSITEKFMELIEDDRHYVKMLVKLDDYFARAFFAKKIVIVEGDTEDVVLRKSVNVLPKEIKNSIMCDFQFIKARGKATIPPLIKYFEALGIRDYFIIHDRDQGVFRAEDVNPRILQAIQTEERRVMLEECIEDALGYEAPSKDKPYRAYSETENWESLEDIPDNWRRVIERVFVGYLE
ncbi:ATP-dependent endonuclease [Aquimarina sp. I32.4]|uniref:ATP-dependent nuclease n=1 Tax=Aquimarina sp. I32.4 TaxID=2053903 RepID=UPI000CDEA786|nr:AAA family ATPase [Aquimarina sp. I32.4]